MPAMPTPPAEGRSQGNITKRRHKQHDLMNKPRDVPREKLKKKRGKQSEAKPGNKGQRNGRSRKESVSWRHLGLSAYNSIERTRR